MIVPCKMIPLYRHGVFCTAERKHLFYGTQASGSHPHTCHSVSKALHRIAISSARQRSSSKPTTLAFYVVIKNFPWPLQLLPESLGDFESLVTYFEPKVLATRGNKDQDQLHVVNCFPCASDTENKWLSERIVGQTGTWLPHSGQQIFIAL